MKALERLQKFGSKAYAKMQKKVWSEAYHQKLTAKYGNIERENPIHSPKQKIIKEKKIIQKEIKQDIQKRDNYIRELSNRSIYTNKEILQKLRAEGYKIDNNKAGAIIRNAREEPFIKQFDKAKEAGIMQDSSINRMLKYIKHNIKRGNHKANEELYIKVFDRPDGTPFKPS